MHYNQGYGSQIPVPIDQVFQQNMVNQLPPVPNSQSAQQLPQHEVGDLHAALINQIQGQTAKGPVRILMFNLYSDRQFCNQLYAELFETAVEYLVAARMSNVPVTPEQVADETLKVDILTLIDRYPDLKNYMSQQQGAEIQQVVQLRNQISNLVRTVQQQMQPQPNYGGGFQPPGGHGMYQQPQQPGGFPNHMGGGFSGQQGSPMAFRSAQGTMPGGGHMQRPMSQGYPSQHGPRPGAVHGRATPGPTRPSASMIDPGNQSANVPTGSSGRKPTVGAMPVDTSNVLTRKDESMKYVPDVDREIGHLMALDEQKQNRYAAPIDREIQFVSDRHAPAIRLDQKLIYGKNDKGTVTYTVIDVEEGDMNYNDHEEQPDMQRLARETKVSKKIGVPAEWKQITVPNEIDEADENAGEVIEAGAPISLKMFVDGYGIDHARTEAHRRLIDKGIDDLDGRVVEYYLSVKTPTLATNEEARHIESLFKSKDLTNLIDNFAAIRDDLSTELWFMIHDRMTCIFNRHLQAGVAFNGEIESIVEDYEDALEALLEEITSAAVDRFKLNAYMSILKGITIRHSPKTKVLDFVEKTSLTILPWSSTEMDLQMPAKYNMVTSSVNDNMHASFLRIFKRTNVEGLSVNRRYVVTADNVWLELVHSDISAETILLSKVNRC